MTLALKPCPYCGSSRLENLDAAQQGIGAVRCIPCGARGPDPGRLDVADGFEAWNFRVVDGGPRRGAVRR